MKVVVLIAKFQIKTIITTIEHIILPQSIISFMVFQKNRLVVLFFLINRTMGLGGKKEKRLLMPFLSLLSSHHLDFVE